MVFCVWLLLSAMFVSFIHVILHSFLWLNTIPSCGYTTFRLHRNLKHPCLQCVIESAQDQVYIKIQVLFGLRIWKGLFLTHFPRIFRYELSTCRGIKKPCQLPQTFGKDGSLCIHFWSFSQNWKWPKDIKETKTKYPQLICFETGKWCQPHSTKFKEFRLSTVQWD